MCHECAVNGAAVVTSSEASATASLVRNTRNCAPTPVPLKAADS